MNCISSFSSKRLCALAILGMRSLSTYFSNCVLLFDFEVDMMEKYLKQLV